MEFYYLSNNSSRNLSAVWFSGASASEHLLHECKMCGTRVTEPAGVIRLQPNPEKGSFWPDVAGMGGGRIGLYVSAPVKECFDEEGIRYGKAFPAKVEPPFPRLLQAKQPPTYFNVTGEFGARMDFEACGYRILGVCPACGYKKVDPGSRATRDAFVDGSWNGADIFYTDLSRAAIFCTERILTLAKRHKWKNFRFVPLERTYDFSYKGINYLVK